MTESKNGNFCLDYLLVITGIAIPVAFYSTFWSATGSPNPLNWGKGLQVHFMVYTIILPLFLFTCYGLSTSDIDVEKVLHKAINLKEYEDKPFFDLIFTHYTNVATIGLFWMIIIFTLKPYISSIDGFSLGGLLGIIMISMFVLYTLIFVKTGIRLAAFNKITYFVVSLTLFFIDSQAIKLFLASVPKAIAT
ncbi:MAG: hypothetical protein ACRC2N_05455 [Aeromonas sp.]